MRPPVAYNTALPLAITAGATEPPPVVDAEIPGDTGSVPARSSPTLRKGSSVVAESARLASTPVPHASSSSTEEDGPHRRLVIVGTRMDDHSLRSQVGMGSESECLFGQLHRISWTSDSEAGTGVA